MKHLRLKIERSDNLQDPRKDYNLGTLWCWHRRASYGDDKPKVGPDAQSVQSLLIGELDPSFDDRELTDEQLSDRFHDLYISLPVYAYEHSGIVLSTGPFSDRWDSGRLGLIFVSKDRARKELGLEGDGWSPAQIEQVHRSLKDEVKTYGQYISGDVFGFTVESFEYGFEIPVGDPVDIQDDNLDWQPFDGCWGFFGDDPVDIQDDNLDWQPFDGCWGFFGDDPTENGMADSFGSNQHPALKEAQMNLGRWVALPAREFSHG